jgi:hypothetical protein
MNFQVGDRIVFAGQQGVVDYVYTNGAVNVKLDGEKSPIYVSLTSIALVHKAAPPAPTVTVDERNVVAIVKAIKKTAKSTKFFTTDDVWAAVDTFNGNPNLMGTLMQQVAKSGSYIRKTDRRKKSTRPSANRRAIAVWESLL